MRFFKDLIFVAATVCVVGVSANGVKLDFDDVMQNAVEEQGDDKTIVDLLKPKRFQGFIVFKLDSMGRVQFLG